MTEFNGTFPESKAWAAHFPPITKSFSTAKTKPAGAADAEYLAFAALDIGFVGCSEPAPQRRKP